MKRSWVLVAVMMMMSVFLFSGCITDTGDGSSTTIGNGKVDPAEAASIRLAVGLSFTAYPKAIVPAYAVSTAILEILPSDPSRPPVEVSQIDSLISKEVDKLNLDPLTKQSFNDLVALAKTKIIEQLGVSSDASTRTVVIHDVLTIIQQTAAARMQLATN